ncbi:hypothetical protein L3X38_018836 [Prunus dulcis]|uniref:Uncharacterized protein n=1 Tax=Prunus dulcis TaxID=3755 RepID=A0AAD4ZBI2_PRUDU|nr:hypothetical protein L3X38_018836 [Prunus dulcis]
MHTEGVQSWKMAIHGCCHHRSATVGRLQKFRLRGPLHIQDEDFMFVHRNVVKCGSGVTLLCAIDLSK